jgi:ADP-heptose:LPS heptosyltransferase
MSQVQELTGDEVPFWIVCAGGTCEKTIKWWNHERFQAVIDAFRDRILFVQVGGRGDHHPELSGVVDLRGKTDLRQLIRLIHHAQGVLSPLNFLVHLSAAVETKHNSSNRASVVIAGGAQSTQWQRYPTHQFLHTIGSLKCCATAGCGRHRTYSLSDRSPSDVAEKICLDVVDDLPHCMQMIGASAVIRSIQRYFEGGALNYLSANEVEVARKTRADGADLSRSMLGLGEQPSFTPQDQV